MAEGFAFGIKISASGAPESARDVGQVEAAVRKVQQANADAAKFAEFLKQTYGDLSDAELRQIEQALKGVAQETEKAEKAAGGLNQVFQGIAQGVGQQFTQLGGEVLRGLVQGIQDVVGAAAEQVGAFEDARAAASTLTDDTDTLIANLEKAQAGLKNQVGTTDLLAASYDVLSSGFTDAADAAAVTEAAARGAIAGFSQTGVVADALTSILNAYGKEAGDAAQVVDQLVKTQDLGKITIDQYAQTIGRAASIAAQSGVSFEEFSAAVATATAKGVPAESAVSGVRQAIVNLLKPTADGQKLLEKYGISNATATLRAEGLVGVLQRLADQGAASDELGKIFSDVDALASVATLAGDNIGDFKASIEGIEGAVGTADVAIQKITDTLNAQRKALEVQVSEGLLDIGRSLEPAFAGLVGLLGDILSEAGAAAGGLDPLVEAGNRLQAVLEENPEIAERLGAAFAQLADEAVEQFALIIESIAGFLANQNNIDQIAESIENIGLAITAAGGAARFLIALAEGVATLITAAEGLPVVGDNIEAFRKFPTPIVLVVEAIKDLIGVFDLLKATVVDAMQGTVDAVGQAFPALEPLLNQIERILDLITREPDPKAFASAASGASASAQALNGLGTALDGLKDKVETLPQVEPPVSTDATEEAKVALEDFVNFNKAALAQIENDTLRNRAEILERGGTQAEIAAAEQEALEKRVTENKRYLNELKSLQAQGAFQGDDAKNAADAIAAIEQQLLRDRVAAAQATAQAQKAAEQERVKSAQEAAKKITDALKEEREGEKRTAEEAFGEQQRRAEEAFNRRQEDQAEAFQSRQQADQEAFNKRQQAASEAFQERQRAKEKAFQDRLAAERDQRNREFQALQEESQRRTAIATAGNSRERREILAQVRREQGKDAAKELEAFYRANASQIRKLLREGGTDAVSEFIERGVVAGQEQILAGADTALSPLEQARADFEAQLQAQQEKFAEAQRQEAKAFSEAQKEEQKAFQQEQRDAAEAFADQQKSEDRAFAESQRQAEAAFKEQQRQLDRANAEQIAAILERAKQGIAPTPRRDGGPILPGQAYLVGEVGPELVFPSRAGYVATARETAQLMALATPSARINAMPSTGKMEAQLEAILRAIQKRPPIQAPLHQTIQTQSPRADAIELGHGHLQNLIRGGLF